MQACVIPLTSSLTTCNTTLCIGIGSGYVELSCNDTLSFTLHNDVGCSDAAGSVYSAGSRLCQSTGITVPVAMLFSCGVHS